MEYFDEKAVNLLDWPARSPDLNIIENVWNLLKHAVFRQNPQNLSHLKALIVQEWDKIDQSTIQKLFDSVPRRLCAVESVGGDMTKY
jgi:hypothetical protein